MPLTHPEIEFKLILCDAAQADPVTGKLNMLGAGWTIVPTPTPPHAVALMVQVPWDRTNEQLAVTVELLDGDGHPVEVPGAIENTQVPLRQEAQLEAGRPPGVARGSNMSAAFALNIGPLLLAPGRYEWRATIANTVRSEFFEVSTTMPRGGPQQ